MANSSSQTTQESKRQSRLHQGRFAQSLAKTRQGFYEAPKKLRSAQREIFLTTALGSSPEVKKFPADQTGRKIAPTLSGFLARKFVGSQLAGAEKEKASGAPTPQPFSTRFRDATSRTIEPRSNAESKNQTNSLASLTGETDRKSNLLQNQSKTRRGFPTIPVSPPIPFKPKEEENTPLDRPQENEPLDRSRGLREENENQPEIDQEILQTQQLAQNQQLERQRQQTEASQTQAVSGQTKGASDKVRKKAMTYIRRGVEELAQGIGNAFDLGTVGVSTLVTIFMYAVNLTDLSMQTVSCYIKNGPLSFLFPPLDEWEPIPISTKMLPIFILHGAIILADLFVLGMILFAFTLIMILAFGPAIGLGTLIYQLSGGSDTFLPIFNFFAQVF